MYCNSMSCCMPFTLHRIHYVESMSCSSMSCNSMSCPIPVLYVEFDFLQFDLKSTNFEDPKKTSNKIRRIVNSVISVYKVLAHEVYINLLCYNRCHKVPTVILIFFLKVDWAVHKIHFSFKNICMTAFFFLTAFQLTFPATLCLKERDTIWVVVGSNSAFLLTRGSMS